MKNAISWKELIDLLQYVSENNGPFTLRKSQDGKYYPIVKYAAPLIDFRTNDCYGIKLIGFGWTEEFLTTNEFRDHPQTIAERVKSFLNTPHENKKATDVKSNH